MSRRIMLNKPVTARTVFSIEDFEIEGAMDQQGEIDTAEEMATQTANNEADLNTVDTLTARAEALEDLAAVADSTQEATENDLVLTEIVSDLATQGTDLSTDVDVVPGLESYLGKSISAEGFKETAAKMWKALVQFVKGIWENIKAFFGNVEAQVRILKKKLKEAAKYPGASKVSKERAASKNFSINGKGPSSAQDMLANLSKTAETLSNLLSGYATNVSQAIDAHKASNDIDPKKVSGDTVLKSLEDKIIGLAKSAKTFDGKSLLGACKLEVADFPSDSDLTSKKVAALSSVKFLVVAEEGSAGAADFEVSSDDKTKIFNKCLDILDTVEKFRSDKVEKFEMKLSDRFINKIGEAGAQGPSNADLQAFMRTLNQATRLLTRFSSQPFQQVVGKSISVLRSHVSVLDVEKTSSTGVAVV